MSEREYTITVEMLKGLDALYEDAEPYGPPPGQWHRMWGVLVEELREIRRLIQAEVTVKVEGTETVFTEWWDFYEWCHARSHKLEDGFDKLIGDDN